MIMSKVFIFVFYDLLMKTINIMALYFLYHLFLDSLWIAILTLTESLTFILEMDRFILQSPWIVNCLNGTILPL